MNRQQEKTDIFCLQEVSSNPFEEQVEGSTARVDLFEKLTVLLSDFQPLWAPAQQGWVTGDQPNPIVRQEGTQGLAMFVKKDIAIQSEQSIFVHGRRNSLDPDDLTTMPRNIQIAELHIGDKRVFVCNFHGLWFNSDKGDNEARRSQSFRLHNALERITRMMWSSVGNTSVVLCGDFNVLPDTKSICSLEERGLENLNKRYGIQNTRSEVHYKKPIRHADYMFTGNAKTKEFKVLPEHEVSDHLPLLVQFSHQ